MVHTTYLWRFGGWFLIVLITLLDFGGLFTPIWSTPEKETGSLKGFAGRPSKRGSIGQSNQPSITVQCFIATCLYMFHRSVQLIATWLPHPEVIFFFDRCLLGESLYSILGLIWSYLDIFPLEQILRIGWGLADWPQWSAWCLGLRESSLTKLWRGWWIMRVWVKIMSNISMALRIDNLWSPGYGCFWPIFMIYPDWCSSGNASQFWWIPLVGNVISCNFM